MERKDAMIKMEDPMVQSSSVYCDPVFSRNTIAGMLDVEGDYGIVKSSSLGFVELLGIQDFTPSIFDMLQLPSTEVPTKSSTVPESSEVLNTPATPNSSSISSESSGGGGAANDEHTKLPDEDEHHHKTKKQLKVKKTSSGGGGGGGQQQQGKQRVARVAFMTKSEVDHLEDGYRWRKYGQKAVKNSPFPRSYYRCTSASCNVKKRVERCMSDPSIVVTTYEGQHTHPSPVMHHGRPIPSPGAAPFFPYHHLILPPPLLQMNHLTTTSTSTSATTYQPPQFNNNILAPINMNMNNMMISLSCGNFMTTTTNSTSTPLNPAATIAASMHDQRRFCSTTTPPSSYIGDHGLLQDIVPSIVRDHA